MKVTPFGPIVLNSGGFALPYDHFYLASDWLRRAAMAAKVGNLEDAEDCMHEALSFVESWAEARDMLEIERPDFRAITHRDILRERYEL